MAGYSNTPLPRKLGIGENMRIRLIHAPPEYEERIAPLPAGTRLVRTPRSPVDLVHIFTRSAADLSSSLPELKNTIAPNGVIWVSWPKKASKVATDVTEDVIRAIALPLQLVDVKVCAIDDTWSGLKLVIRKSAR